MEGSWLDSIHTCLSLLETVAYCFTMELVGQSHETEPYHTIYVQTKIKN